MEDDRSLAGFSFKKIFWRKSEDYEGFVELVLIDPDVTNTHLLFDGIDFRLIDNIPNLKLYELDSELLPQINGNYVISNIEEDKYSDFQIHLENIGHIKIIARLDIDEQITQQVIFRSTDN